MNVAEEFALGQYLSDYPPDLEYDDVIAMILDEDDEVLIWAPFDNYPRHELCTLIDDLRDSFRYHLKRAIHEHFSQENKNV